MDPSIDEEQPRTLVRATVRDLQYEDKSKLLSKKIWRRCRGSLRPTEP